MVTEFSAALSIKLRTAQIEVNTNGLCSRRTARAANSVMAGLDPAIPMRMVADWHCIFRKAEVGRGGWVKPSQHAVGESIISAFGISHRADALAAFAGCVPTVLWCCPGSISARRRRGWRDQHRLGLRAGDALHLAICVDRGATMCTLDRRLGEVGPLVGVQALLV